MEHCLNAIEGGEDGQKMLRYKIAEVPATYMACVRLQTLAIANQLKCADNPLIRLPPQASLESLIDELKFCIGEERHQSELGLFSGPRHAACSICGASAGTSDPVTLYCNPLQLRQRQLRQLIEKRSSSHQVGQNSAWQQFLKRVHDLGFHVRLQSGHLHRAEFILWSTA